MWSRRKAISSIIGIMALLMAMPSLVSCSDDDDITIEDPTLQGTFIDERDGTTYHFVHLAGLDWSVENLAYDLGDTDLSRIYQSSIDYDRQTYSAELRAKYGMLYSYTGAQQAIPAGWRLPSDADWAALEASNGYLSTAFGLLYAGYYTKNTHASADNGSRFMGSWAYFWTATSDESKDGQFYFARKKFYSVQQTERLSLEPGAYFLSVRFVRDPLYYSEK